MIYFVRHGQTDWNILWKLQGQTDIPLNETGIIEAHATAEKLKEKKIDIIITSDLSRAYNTAEIINKFHNVPLITDKRVREISFGIYEGVLASKIDFNEFMDFDKNTLIEDAETVHHCYERTAELLDEIKENYKNKNVLIVSHGGISICIKKYFNVLHMYPDIKSAVSHNCVVDEYSFTYDK